jgi:hypothetical protein
MISAKDLRRCIDILAELNVHASSQEKRLILEVGYILKQELNAVEAWDSQIKSNKERGYDNIDVKKLLEDNTQLFKENEKLLKSLAKMKEIIDSKIPAIQEDLSVINGKFDMLNNHIERNLC